MSGTECNGFYTGTFKAFPEIPAEGNSIAFMAYFHGDMNSYYKFKATISIEGDNLIFTPEEAVEGGKVTLKRSTLKPTVNWVGTWKVKARNTGDNICAPKSEVVIAEQGSSLLVSWIWDSSEVCKTVGLDGKKFISSVPIPVNNPVMLYIRVHDIETLGFFSVAQDTGIWAHSNFPGHLTFEKSSNGSFLTVALVVLAVAVSVAGVLLISK